MWILNKWMIAGLVIGSLIFVSAENIFRAANHHGPGIEHFGGGGDQDGLHPASPDVDVKMSEKDYKRNEFVLNGVMLGIYSLAWCWVAKRAEEKDARRTDGISN